MKNTSTKLSDQLMSNTHITPIREGNQVKRVTKTADGGLMVEQKSGNTFKLDADNEMFQAFVIYTMLADYTR